MKEIKAIVESYDTIEHEKVKTAIATVVEVEGSSYRRTGARMLVMDNGSWIGGISGGCLEGDALKRARLAIAKSEPSLVTYDTSEDDQHQIGVGLGCNGIIKVLFTPINPDDKNNIIACLKKFITHNRQTHILLTVINLKGEIDNTYIGHTIVYNSSIDLDFLASAILKSDIELSIQKHLHEGRSRPQKFYLENGNEIEIFIEIILPQISLILMGHQYDTLPLARLIKEIGWYSILVANKQKLIPSLFSIADEIVLPQDFSSIIIDTHTAIILMSHDYKTDKQNLKIALSTPTNYIGMLGPRVRSEKIFNELANEGYIMSECDMKRIYAPVGLDIGAISPEEIALSIIAEVRSIFANRSAGSLRMRMIPIHERN